MALGFCPECKKEVSSKAATCPNCGAPITEILAPPSCVTKVIFWILCVIVGFVITYFILDFLLFR